MPEVHTEGNIRADREFAERIVGHADGLIAVSENTRQDAIRLLGVAPEKIRTIHSGISEAYFSAVPLPRTKPYVLYVGTIEPRKNLDRLLDAWGSLKLRDEFALIIAGPRGWGSEKTFARIEREALYAGYVREHDLPGLFAGAEAFLYPSLYEGFGFPVVQAMAAGIPVVTSNNSCLPEIAGDAAVFVDAMSVSEIAKAIENVLTTESLRRSLIEKGRARAQMFRWPTCAAQSKQFFEEIISR